MCNFLSAIVTEHESFYDFDNDNHEALIKKHNLNDKTDYPYFVRLEYSPTGDILDDKTPWKLKIDQNLLPDWFSEKYALAEMEKIRELFYRERVIKDKKELKK